MPVVATLAFPVRLLQINHTWIASLFTLILGFVVVTIAYELAHENNAHLWFSREIVVGNDTVDNNTVLLKFLFSG